MAAAKVFAVPELLENILLQATDMAIIAEIHKPKGARASPQPLKSLAPCHRVSRDFNNVLVGSVKLQRLLYGDCNPSYHRTYGRSLPELGAATWLVETQGGCTNYASSGLDFDFDMWDHSSGARDIRTKGHDYPGASWRRIRFSRGATSNSKPVLCASYIETQYLSGEYDDLTYNDIVMIYPGVTLGTFQAWTESSTKDVGSETSQMSFSSGGRRGTWDDPLVLREAPADDGPGAQDSEESGVESGVLEERS